MTFFYVIEEVVCNVLNFFMQRVIYLLLYHLWEDATENDPSQVKRLLLREHRECTEYG